MRYLTGVIFDFANVELDDFFASLQVRGEHLHLHVKPAWSQQRSAHSTHTTVNTASFAAGSAEAGHGLKELVF